MFKRWLYQFGSFLIAWVILLAASGILDEWLNTDSQYLLAVWLAVGIGVMYLKKMNFPMPKPDRVDVPGAFKMLWWAAFWPGYLFKIR